MVLVQSQAPLTQAPPLRQGLAHTAGVGEEEKAWEEHGSQVHGRSGLRTGRGCRGLLSACMSTQLAPLPSAYKAHKAAPTSSLQRAQAQYPACTRQQDRHSRGVQVPLMHWSVLAHAAPHLPQWSLSVARSVHAPEQQPLPAGHAAPHAPQLAASSRRRVHTGAVAPVKPVAGQLYDVAGDHLSGAGRERMAAAFGGVCSTHRERRLRARGSLNHHTHDSTVALANHQQHHRVHSRLFAATQCGGGARSTRSTAARSSRAYGKPAGLRTPSTRRWLGSTWPSARRGCAGRTPPC